MQNTIVNPTQSKDFFFDITNRSKMPVQVYIGGRGIGKTYSALRFLSEFPADEKWIYMRRTDKEIEACGTDFGIHLRLSTGISVGQFCPSQVVVERVNSSTMRMTLTIPTS